MPIYVHTINDYRSEERVILASISIMFDYQHENIDYKPDVIDEYLLKNNLSKVLYKGIFIASIAFISLYFNKKAPINISGGIAYFVLNLSLIIYSVSFSEGHIFKNKISNVILLLNVLIQVGILLGICKSNIIV